MTDTKELTIEWTKIHCMIPKSLFKELKRKGLLKQIDNLIIGLLTKHLEELK